MENPDWPVFCRGCGAEIDPGVCGCGEYIQHAYDGHYPIPMGCNCGRGYLKPEKKIESLKYAIGRLIDFIEENCKGSRIRVVEKNEKST